VDQFAFDNDSTDEVDVNVVIVVCFKVFDCDRDGLLSMTELHQMFAAMLVVHQMNQSPAAHSMVCLTLWSVSLYATSAHLILHVPLSV